MSYHFDFDPTNRILRCRLYESVTDEVLEEFYQALTDYALHFDPKGGVADFSGVSSFTVSPQTARKLAYSEPAMPDPRHLRVVIAPPDHIYGMARLFQLVGEQTRPSLHIVRTLKEAWAILGGQDPKFEPVQIK